MSALKQWGWSVEPRRFQLEGPSIDALKAKVLAEHGPRARIIAAEKVTVGGIGGFLSRAHYEVTVELPPRGRRRAAGEPDAHRDAGLLALLDRAEKAEARLRDPSADSSTAVSTASPAFAELMDTLTFSTETADAPVEPVALIPAAEPLNRLRPAPPPPRYPVQATS